jgi:hypothetical protein
MGDRWSPPRPTASKLDCRGHWPDTNKMELRVFASTKHVRQQPRAATGLVLRAHAVLVRSSVSRWTTWAKVRSLARRCKTCKLDAGAVKGFRSSSSRAYSRPLSRRSARPLSDSGVDGIVNRYRNYCCLRLSILGYWPFLPETLAATSGTSPPASSGMPSDARTLFSISRERSGFSFKNSRALSRP